MSLTRKRIRLVADAGLSVADALVDVFSNSTPEIWRGNDVQFEIGIHLDDEVVVDITNIASLTVEVKDYADRDGVALMTKTLAAASLKQDLSDALWDGNLEVNCHALVPFTAAESNVDLGASDSKRCWLVISVITNDTPGRHITIQAGELYIHEDGTGSAGAPQNNVENYYDKGSADARFQQRHADGASMAFKDGQHPYLYCAGKWYPLVATMVDGVPVPGLGEGVDSI